VAGEGELKIIQFLRQHEQERNVTHIVAGSDSDLLVQTVLIERANVSVLDLQSQNFIDVGRLKSLWKALIPNVPIRSIAYDFVVVAILQGNDYLPRWRGVGLDSMWKTYIDLRRGGLLPLYDPDQSCINLLSLQTLLKKSVKHTPKGSAPVRLERSNLKLAPDGLMVSPEVLSTSGGVLDTPLPAQPGDETVEDDDAQEEDEEESITDDSGAEKTGDEGLDEDEEDEEVNHMDPATLSALWSQYSGEDHCRVRNSLVERISFHVFVSHWTSLASLGRSCLVHRIVSSR